MLLRDYINAASGLLEHVEAVQLFVGRLLQGEIGVVVALGIVHDPLEERFLFPEPAPITEDFARRLQSELWIKKERRLAFHCGAAGAATLPADDTAFERMHS